MSKKTRHSDLKWGLHVLAVSFAIMGELTYLAIMCGWGLLAYLAWRDAPPKYPPNWWELRHAVTAPLLFGTFLAAILMRKRAKVFRTLLAAAFATMACWSLYDCYHRSYQIGTHSLEYGWDNYHVLGKGARHVYVNWPWITELELWLPQKKSKPLD